MEIIGIICEYNPFHNGHKYHIEKIKQLYPESLIILVLNGYFLQRGEVSIINKKDKVDIALNNNVDIVLEHPFVFSSNSADIFADSAVKILNKMKCNKIVFGSESNDIEFLKKVATKQLSENFDETLKMHLDTGINYPSAIQKSLGMKIKTPNDLLGVSYVKSIIKNNFDIEPITIKRTNSFHDISSNNEIISATNIRQKIVENINISKFTNYQKHIKTIDSALLFNLIKYKIITHNNLNVFLTVDEGLEYRLKKMLLKSSNIEELINNTKSKRYTYNRVRRMLIHILIGLEKNDVKDLEIEYIKTLGFNKRGQQYIRNLKQETEFLINSKISDTYLTQKYELKCSEIYDMLTNGNNYNYEIQNKPIVSKK